MRKYSERTGKHSQSIKQCAGCFTRLRYPFRRLSFFVYTDIGGSHKINRFAVTKADALRISITEITFEYLLVLGVITHSAERADRYAGTTANADIIIDFNVLNMFVAGNRLHRTCIHAWGIFTLLT